jgi:hypothetical protein
MRPPPAGYGRRRRRPVADIALAGYRSALRSRARVSANGRIWPMSGQTGTWRGASPAFGGRSASRAPTATASIRARRRRCAAGPDRLGTYRGRRPRAGAALRVASSEAWWVETRRSIVRGEPGSPPQGRVASSEAWWVETRRSIVRGEPGSPPQGRVASSGAWRVETRLSWRMMPAPGGSVAASSVSRRAERRIAAPARSVAASYQPDARPAAPSAMLLAGVRGEMPGVAHKPQAGGATPARAQERRRPSCPRRWRASAAASSMPTRCRAAPIPGTAECRAGGATPRCAP